MHQLTRLGNKTLTGSIFGRIASLAAVITLFFVVVFFQAKAITTDIDGQFATASAPDYLSVINANDVGENLIYTQEGIASWYGKRFHNRLTANGERYNMHEFSAAHKKLPFGTILRVTNKNTGKNGLVRINDRGPFVHKRIIDLSYKSAKTINVTGISDVKIEGFLPGSASNLKDEKENYYFGYSYEYPLVCLPDKVVEIVDSTATFHDAVQTYNEYLKTDADKVYYLMAPVDEMTRREKIDEYNYFIGEITDKPQNLAS